MANFTSPVLSVVIPCYNSEKWVGIAIESVLAQASENIEIVVVNDGSTDGTLAILESFGSKVRIVNKPNGGVVSARNSGVLAARGAYLKFLDADDIIPVGAISILLDAVLNFPQAAFIGRSNEISENGAVLGEKMYGIGYRPSHMSEVRSEYLLTQATQSGLWLLPRILIIEHDLLLYPRIELGEEYEFCMRIIHSRIPIHFIDSVIYSARAHDGPGRLSRTIDEIRHLKQVDIIYEVVNFIKTNLQKYDDEALLMISRLCWSRGRDCVRIDCINAANSYFILAKKVRPDIKPVGSTVYRLVCKVFGPIAAERLLEKIKFTVNKWNFI